MTQLNTYLTFNGNCRQAMDFYQQCLGGELVFQTIGESPLADKMPAQMKNCILHATLTHSGLILMGSDMSPQGLTKGNTVSLMLNCSSDAEIEKFFTSLSAAGVIINPLEKTFWGGTIGNFTDKFGYPWILHFTTEDKK